MSSLVHPGHIDLLLLVHPEYHPLPQGHGEVLGFSRTPGDGVGMPLAQVQVCDLDGVEEGDGQPWNR